MPNAHDQPVFKDKFKINYLGGIMGGAMRFVFALIWLALALGVTGNLVEATFYAKSSATDIYKSKGTSATWWNSKLSRIQK